eukprot:157047_1
MRSSSNSSFDQFTALQNALSELNYSQPLLRESVPLVQAIFTDLIEVTKKYTQIRKQSELKEKELKSQLDPIKTENDNLTKSNNTLHLQIIQNHDQFKAQTTKIEKEYDALKLERNEMNILLNQKKSKIKNQEIMIHNLKKKMNAVIAANGTNHKQLIGKTAKISFTSNTLSQDTVGDEAGETRTTTTTDSSRYTLLENENESLLQQLKELRQVSVDDQSQIGDLEGKLAARNEEIARIHSTVQIDDNRIKYIELKREEKDESERIKHLSSQIEVLQNEVMDKERAIAEDGVKDGVISQLKNENAALNEKVEITWRQMEELKMDLSGIKQNAKALQLDKKYDILKSSKKLHKNVSEMALLHDKIGELSKKNAVLERKLQQKIAQHKILSDKARGQMAQTQTLSVQLEMKEKEIDSLRTQQVSACKERDSFGHKLKELERKMEMSDANRRNAESQFKSRENKLQTLRKDNVLWSEKYEELEKMNRCAEEKMAAQSRVLDENELKMARLSAENESQSKRLVALIDKHSSVARLETVAESAKFELVKQLQSMQFKCEDLVKEKEWNEASLIECRTKCDKLEVEKSELRTRIDRIQCELDATKLSVDEMKYRNDTTAKERESLRSKLAQSETMIASLGAIKSSSLVTEKAKNALEFELVSLRADKERLSVELEEMKRDAQRKCDVLSAAEEEKHSLKLILQQMQQGMAAAQQRLNVINAEREQIKRMSDEAQLELQKKAQLLAKVKAQSNVTKSELCAATNLCADFKEKLASLRHEFETKSQLLAASQSKMKEFAAIRDELQSQLRSEMHDKEGLAHELQQEKRAIEEMTRKYDAVRCELNDAVRCSEISRGELASAHSKNGELRTLCSKLDDGHRAAQCKIGELYSSLEQQRQRIELSMEGAAEREVDRENMAMALEKLVASHDALQNELDGAAEVASALKQQQNAALTRCKEYESILAATQDKYRLAQKELRGAKSEAATQRELCRKYEKQIMPQLKQELRLMKQLQHNAQNDWDKMTAQIAFLNGEYSVSVADRDDKTQKLSSALNRVLFLEENCRNFKSEKSQILENYRCVVAENEKLSKIATCFDENRTQSKMRISVLEGAIASRDERICAVEAQLSEANVCSHELQRQNQNMTRELSRVHLNASKMNQKSHNLERDLQSIQNDVVAKQMSDLHKKNQIIVKCQKELKNLQNHIQNLNAEKECALNSLNKTEMKITKLEQIIKQLRMNQSQSAAVEEEEEVQPSPPSLPNELCKMKDLNKRLNQQLHKIQEQQQHHHHKQINDENQSSHNNMRSS